MGDALAPAVFQGLFKRETKGQLLPPATVHVERGKIQFFSQVVEEADAIHHSAQVARAAGYPDIVAPAAFFTVIDMLANDELRRGGHLPPMDLVGCDERYLLHGDETYEYLGPIFAGDDIIVQTQISDFYVKKGGAMEFVVFDSTLTHADRGVLLRATRTLLHRLG